jgi:ABC-2 type transport system ATP-binding protein
VQEAKRRGQTVFLSSHILSEVEALCDRVGILRAGRLVDQGTLDQLRHLSAQTIEVTFEGPAPTLDGLPGVHVTSAGVNALRCEVRGSVRPLLAALADYPVAGIASREPSLEEIFLHHYDTSSNGRGSR